MEIEDIEGQTSVDSETDLQDRLRSVRKGVFGAFILSHHDCECSLWIHIKEPTLGIQRLSQQNKAEMLSSK